jgi:uncharacterized membrane protein YhaH (DUF805 family)
VGSLIVLYLTANVLANLSSATFGPAASIINAFLFIGLDLTTRDRLHDQWRGRGLWWRMLALITVGGLISYVINRNAGSIALASFAAFTAAGIVDALAYQVLHRAPFLARANGSNVPSALVDSLVFPTLAFGGFLPGIVLGQFLAKACGGFVWSLALNYRREALSRAPQAIQEASQ